jgi:hypothetical protein
MVTTPVRPGTAAGVSFTSKGPGPNVPEPASSPQHFKVELASSAQLLTLEALTAKAALQARDGHGHVAISRANRL